MARDIITTQKMLKMMVTTLALSTSLGHIVLWIRPSRCILYSPKRFKCLSNALPLSHTLRL